MQDNENIVHNMGDIKVIEANQIKVIERPSNDPMSLIELAINGDLDVGKIDQLMALQERWEDKIAKKSFYNSFSAFQSDMPVINRIKKGHHDAKYAPIEEIVKQIKYLLVEHGLSFSFEEGYEEKLLVCTCTITHKEGYSKSNSLRASPDTSGNKSGIHSMASTVSYLRRYTLTGALGIVMEDEDNDADERNNKPNKNDFYPNDLFKQNLPQWRANIAKGQDPDNIIKFLSNKNIKLSPSQIKKVKSK